MRDTLNNLSCEEVFELNAFRNQWQQETTEYIKPARKAELAERQRKAAAEMFWFIQKRRQQGDWF